MTLQQIREAFGLAASKEPGNGVGLPPAVYLSPQLFELEAAMFRREWFVIARVDQVAAPGSFYSVDLLGEPLLLTRDREGKVHVFYRVCPHRGTELVAGCGAARLLVCPYHSWSFDLAGRLKAAPEMGHVEGFDRSQQGLRPVRFEVWEGFVFVNLDGRAEDLGERLAGLSAELCGSHLSDFVIARTIDWGEVAVDWKVIAENSMECYHHLGTHARSLQSCFPAELSWTRPEQGSYVLTYSEPRAEQGGSPAAGPSLSAAPIVTIFPYAHFTARPEGGTFLQVFPVAAGKIHVLSHVMLPRELAAAPDAERLIAEREARTRMIMAEDFAICDKVQRTASSRSTAVGRLSLLEEPLRQFYRYLTSRLWAGE